MKSPLTAGLLWLFLGLAGGHRFYLRMDKAGWMLALFLCVLLVPFLRVVLVIALIVWWAADGAMLLEWVKRYNEEQHSGPTA